MGVDGAPVTVSSDGMVVYRASALGMCSRALAAARQELDGSGEIPATLQKAYDRGNRLEEVGLKGLATIDGWDVKEGRDELCTLRITDNISIFGHVDGVATLNGQQMVVEVKSQNESEFNKKSITDSQFWYKYKYQFSAYMIAMGLPLVCVRVGSGEDKAIKLEYFWVPPVSKAKLAMRIGGVESLARRDLIGVECEKGEEFGCPYWKLLHAPREIVEEVIVQDQELAELAIEYENLRATSSEMSKKVTALRNKLIARLEPGKVTVEEGSGVRVKYTVSKTKEKVMKPGEMRIVKVTLP